MSVVPILVNAEQKMNSHIYQLRKSKLDFTVVETTGTVEVSYISGGKLKTFLYVLDIYDKENEEGKKEEKSDPSLIRNICRVVKMDAKRYLKNNPMPEYNYDHFITIDFDRKLVDTMVEGDILHEIDINSCYWTLAYQKGFISQKTFKNYLPYKRERLIALGNLAKVKYIKTFLKGRQRNEEKERSELAPFFFSIICDIYDLYLKINKDINRKVYYFKTDAFIVPPSYQIENKIASILQEHGMNYKVNRLRIKEVLPGKVIAKDMADQEEKILTLSHHY